MTTLANLRVATRIQLLIGLTLIGLLILCLISLFQLKSSMLEDRKEKTHNLVLVANGKFLVRELIATAQMPITSSTMRKKSPWRRMTSPAQPNSNRTPPPPWRQPSKN